MDKYLTLFNNHQAYTNYKNSNNFATPNVSYCEQENEVHYNPIHDYSKDYFTTIAKESGTITFKYNSDATTAVFTSMSYKKNDGEWVTTQYNPNIGNTIIVSVNNGDKVQWKGINNAFHYYDESYGVESNGYFTSDCHADVEGNIMSLLYGDNFSDKRSLEGRDAAFGNLFSTDGHLQIVSAENLAMPATTLANNCYVSMFYGCTGLTTAPELPATTLANGCYSGMFRGCTSLAIAPELPATTLAEWCYYNMFNGCTSLTTAPELHAFILVSSCYASMFYGCTGLTTAPELPATTLVSNCYNSMFRNCSSLSYIKAMFTTTPSKTYTSNWVSGVASTGTFVKNSAATWNVTGVNGIPSRWTVQTASA